MRAVKSLILVGILLVVVGCGGKFSAYNGPDVTRIVVMKEDRKMYLMAGDRVVRKYNIDLGFAPIGDKQFEGDGKTPEGHYTIDRRNPNSQFYLSLGISYPNVQDVAEAEAAGKSPGGDIFIHGQSEKEDTRGTDWTWGCISVSDREMYEIYGMVKTGTVISIYP